MGEKRNVYLGRRFPGDGVANAWDHPCNTPAPSRPKTVQTCPSVEGTALDVGTVSEKKQQNLLSQNTEVSGFQVNFCVSGDMLVGRFSVNIMSIGNLQIRAKTSCSVKPILKGKENTVLHTHTINEIN